MGTNYYRIKQVDYDGKYEFSNVTFINYQTDIKHLTIHLNPANNQVYVSSQKESKLSIFNQFGVLIEQIELQKGNNEVDMSDMRSGIYIFRTESGEVGRVIKM